MTATTGAPAAAVLEEIHRTQTVMTSAGDILPLENAVTPEEGEFLASLVREIGAERAVEVGLAYGISALYIGAALSATERRVHVVIDPYESGWKNVGIDYLKRVGHGPFTRLIEEPSHQALSVLEREDQKFDFAFIDGYHTFDFALVDFFCIDRILRVGGMVVLDDADWRALRKLCRYIATNRAYRVRACLPVDLSSDTWKKSARRRAGQVVQKAVGTWLHCSDLLPGSRCVAFEKLRDDDRRWDFHRAF